MGIPYTSVLCNLSLTLKRVLYGICMNADGAAAVEALRAELARAKEQARFSNVAAEKASAELRAEQAARHQNEEKISALALELKNTTSRCEYLEKENKAKMVELDKAVREASERIPSKECRTSAAVSGDPEAPETLTDMLRQASVSEEHRALMVTVVEKVLSVKSGLNEAFTSLLKGFEVCDVILPMEFY